MTAALEAKDVVFVRDGRRILDGASLTLARGETATIEGPSGSGKSTLLRVMATLLEPDSGTLVLDGVDARSIPPPLFRKRVAYVAQNPPMLDGSVAHNVSAGPRLRGETLTADAIADLLRQADLPADFAARDARQLSGGERARVAVARALANEPELLLLDEPTAALDPSAATRILDLVRSLGSRGLGVLVVTHAAEHAASIHGTRWVVEAGRARKT
jgi:putative ABC transport system ATP-binding protein